MENPPTQEAAVLPELGWEGVWRKAEPSTSPPSSSAHWPPKLPKVPKVFAGGGGEVSIKPQPLLGDAAPPQYRTFHRERNQPVLLQSQARLKTRSFVVSLNHGELCAGPWPWLLTATRPIPGLHLGLSDRFLTASYDLVCPLSSVRLLSFLPPTLYVKPAPTQRHSGPLGDLQVCLSGTQWLG